MRCIQYSITHNMNIGIIGAGNLGYSLSNYLSNSGHIISISDKNTKKIETIGYQTYSDNVDVIKNSQPGLALASVINICTSGILLALVDLIILPILPSINKILSSEYRA